MPNFTGTNANDTLTIVVAGDYMLDGLGGIDSLDIVGSINRSRYSITQGSDGTVRIDTVSGASEQLHITLKNWERVTFNGGELVDLTTFFGVAPTVSFERNFIGTAAGTFSYALNFSAAVTGLAIDDFTLSNGTVFSVAGSGARYTVLATPSANVEGMAQLSLKAGAVFGSSGLTNALANAALQAVDTRAPSLAAASPAESSSGVAVASNLTFTFSEAVQRGAGTVLVKNGGGAVVGSFDAATSANLSISGSTLTINPSTDLASGSHFSVEFGAAAFKDLAGNAAPGGRLNDFVTAIDPANPALSGTLGNDLFTPGAGALAIDGLAGIDTVALARTRAGYAVSKTASGYSVTATDASANNQLSHVERLQFSDGRLALDIDGNAGAVARIIGAVFGPATVANPVYVGIGLRYLDGALLSFEALCALALSATGETSGKTSHDDIVTLLWTNVVGSAPTAADKAPFVARLDGGMTPGALAALAANTDINAAHIDLVGLANTGLTYVGA